MMHRSLITRLLLSPNERRLRAGWRLIGQTILLYIMLGGVSLGIVGGLTLFSSGTSAIPEVFGFDALTLLSMLASLPAITLSVYLARRFLDRRSFSSLGLQWNGHALRDLIFGIVLTGLMMSLIYLVEWALGWLHFEGFTWLKQAGSVVIGNLIASFFLFSVVGWQEELLNRGYYLHNLTDGWNLKGGVLLSSLIFASLHSLNPNFNAIAWIGLVCAGLFLAYAAVRTRQLWLSIGLHIGWNFFEGVAFGFPVSGSSFNPLIRQSVQGPVLFTGGAFGPEAGILCILVLGLGTFVLYLYTRQ